MTPSLSVVVVSFGRPKALRRCLLGLSQQIGVEIEIVVVADAPGRLAISNLDFIDRVKVLDQPKPHIAIARNLGISAAAGDVVAFVDDDAVPEPTWANAVVGAFQDVGIAAATGPVLGRNGISVQWGKTLVDRMGRDQNPDDVTETSGSLALKLHGTNMAVRREVLTAVQGFDPAYAFYLDDTDLAYRLKGLGYRSVWVDQMVVHHGFQASARRTAARVPLSLYDIGASTSVYLRKHASAAERTEATMQLCDDQRERCLRLVRRRKLHVDKMSALLQGLSDGLQDGGVRELGDGTVTDPAEPFRSLPGRSPEVSALLCGRRLHARRLRAEAQGKVDAGQIVTVFLFEPTPRKHRVTFTDSGWWEHIGGIFGPVVRKEPRIQPLSFKSKVAAEVRRISAIRGLQNARNSLDEQG